MATVMAGLGDPWQSAAMSAEPANNSDLEQFTARARVFASLILDHGADAREAWDEDDRQRHLDGIGAATLSLLEVVNRAVPLGEK